MLTNSITRSLCFPFTHSLPHNLCYFNFYRKVSTILNVDAKSFILFDKQIHVMFHSKICFIFLFHEHSMCPDKDTHPTGQPSEAAAQPLSPWAWAHQPWSRVNLDWTLYYYLLLHSLFCHLEQRTSHITIYSHFSCMLCLYLSTNHCSPFKLLPFLSTLYIYVSCSPCASDLSLFKCLETLSICSVDFSALTLIIQVLGQLTEALFCFTLHLIIYYPYSLLFINCFIVLYIN